MLTTRNLRLSFKVNERWFIISSKRFTATSNWEKFLTTDEQKQVENKWKPVVTQLTQNNKEVTGKENVKVKYILSMFPYPSGNLHMGHVRVYTISDAVARFYSMKGYKVIHPMGWDAFGLPAENAAMERGINPQIWTRKNIERMKEQLKSLGCAFDWWRELTTCDPKYYKWTQFIFLKLYEHGLVYRQEDMVNWDPVDQTVLANEQVDENGISWRSGAKVEKKPLTQWFVKTTRFAKELYEDLSDPSLVNWKDVPAMQRFWIGECNGYVIEMKVEDGAGVGINSLHHFPVWMTHPEYLEDVAFIGLKTGSILNTTKFKQSSKGESIILNLKAVEPLSKRRIPVIVNDALDYENGGQIYVGIPSRNEKDKLLCKDLEIEIPPPAKDHCSPTRDEVIAKLKQSKCGGYKRSAKLTDWPISRQRYWGTPIPIVYCAACGIVPLPEDMLPVQLPLFTGRTVKGVSVLKEDADWLHCPCPRCGQEAERETDTMDTFIDSSWYFLRFLDPENDREPVSRDAAMPVDLYIGGKEHATLHLYYARFMQKFLKSIGLVSHGEPFRQLLMQGMVKGVSYQVEKTGRYLTPEEVDFTASPPVEAKTNHSLIIQHEKMSKSKRNGVDPQSIIEEHGVDAVRLAILAFAGPQSERNWNTEDLDQSFKIMQKLWMLSCNFFHTRKGIKTEKMKPCSEDETRKHEAFLFESRNKFLLASSHSLYTNMQFHSVIRSIQQLIGTLLVVPKNLIFSDEYEKSLRCVLLLLNPIIPHSTAELWDRISEVSQMEQYKQTSSIGEEPWPSIDVDYERDVLIMINKEKVSHMKVSELKYRTLNEEEVTKMAREDARVSSMLDGAQIHSSEFMHDPNFRAALFINTKPLHEIKKIKKKKTIKKEKLAKAEVNL